MTQRAEPLSIGKAKSMYEAPEHDRLIMSFRDDISAFNAVKVANIPGKGALNQKINAFLMKYLAKNGIETHFIEELNDHECYVSKLKMLPVEAVIRNIASGSFCKRFNIKQGTVLHTPIFELFLKSDALGDPLIRDEHAEYFEWASAQDIQQIKSLTFRINALLSELFRSAGMTLVDFKLEFGRLDGRLLLADEISPDGMRIWDAKTQEVLDKDRFRQDLGDVMTGYQKVADLLKI
jgi:phosphoribosylaminoimidazole-succinocarboxamide synthase